MEDIFPALKEIVDKDGAELVSQSGHIQKSGLVIVWVKSFRRKKMGLPP